MSTTLTEIVPNQLLPRIADPLTFKQKSFIRYYLETKNGTEAARLAGYAGNNATLGQVAYENLRKPEVRAELTKLINPIADAQEVLARLSKHSRASIADVLDASGSFDLAYAKANHSDDLIKKLKIKRRIIPVKDGEPEVEITHELELHDAQAATVHLAKHHGLLADRSENINVNIDLAPQDLAQILQGALSAGVIDVEATNVQTVDSKVVSGAQMP